MKSTFVAQHIWLIYLHYKHINVGLQFTYKVLCIIYFLNFFFEESAEKLHILTILLPPSLSTDLEIACFSNLFTPPDGGNRDERMNL